MKRSAASQIVIRRERRGDGRDAIEQQVELIDRFAAEPVGELALRHGAEEQAEQRGARHDGDLGAVANPLRVMSGISEPRMT